MAYFGMFSLLVLPLFLIVSAKMIDQTQNFKHRPFAKVVKFSFYGMAALSIFGAILLFFQIITD